MEHLNQQQPNQQQFPQKHSKNFWEALPNPFFCLAPMADVTDAAFRQIVTKYGKPDVLWTEFVSANGLASAGREALLVDLLFSENERPIVAQFFTADPENMYTACVLARELGFDGIDINMGCPDKSIEKQGAGAAMMKTPEQAVEVIRAAKRGAGDLPVSVKTRIGFNTNELQTWIPLLLAENLAALTIHARTRKEMSKVPARWEHVKEVVEMRNKMGVATKIIGNGDVRDLADAKQKAKETGCDGVMIGRAIFGNPFLFSEKEVVGEARKKYEGFFTRLLILLGLQKPPKYWHETSSQIPLEKRLTVFVEHAKLFEQLLGGSKSFAIMRKHAKGYVHGFPGASELRTKIMEANTAGELELVIRSFLDS